MSSAPNYRQWSGALFSLCVQTGRFVLVQSPELNYEKLSDYVKHQWYVFTVVTDVPCINLWYIYYCKNFFCDFAYSGFPFLVSSVSLQKFILSSNLNHYWLKLLFSVSAPAIFLILSLCEKSLSGPIWVMASADLVLLLHGGMTKELIAITSNIEKILVNYTN